ncbi:MAG: gamma-glutamyl-gamma-aminobutyrate hydrolase family protein [Actinomycetota bacterium]|nr:gamma-glutamyl-gamma-aminobutyrate hydrolase family protein [Actinomycetota bacterium]
MSERPLIGITGRRRMAGDVSRMPKSMAELGVDLYFAGYARQVEIAGGIPVHLPRDGAAEILGRLDGLLLTGGADVDPAIYGARPDPNLGPLEQERDTREIALLEAAAETDMPVFGICRGIQVLNVHAGGTLHQHVADHARQDQPCDQEIHRVHFEKGSLPDRLYGAEIGVNSLHHQAVDQLGEGLRAVGWSAPGPDGQSQVEALESDDGRIFGVQWHPEMMTDPDPAFDWLVRQAAL